MNSSRALFPLAGLLAGAAAAFVVRDGQSGSADQKRGSIPALTARESSGPAALPPPGVANMEELTALMEGGSEVEAYDALAGVPAPQLAAWLDGLLPGKSCYGSAAYTREQNLCEILVQRLAEKDPVALAAWLEKVPYGDRNSDWMRVAVDALLATGTPEAAAALAGLSKDSPYLNSLELESLAGRDPAAALTKLLEGNYGWMPPAIAKWVVQDPGRAVQLANENPAYALPLNSALSHQGRAAMEQFAAGLTNPDAQKMVRRSQMLALAHNGDVGAFTGMLTSTGRGPGDPKEAMDVLARAHPAAAAEAARQLAGLKPGLCGQMLASIAADDPAGAVALLKAPEFSPEAQSSLLRAMLPALTQSWLLSDPAAAKAWMVALPPADRAGVMSFGGWTNELSTSEWAALSQGLPVGKEGNDVFAAQAVQKLQDPAALADWCGSFPDEGGRKLAEQVCSQLAQRDLRQATALAFLVDSNGQTGDLIKGIADVAADKNSADVLAWIASLPPEYQSLGLERTARNLLLKPEAVPAVMAEVQQRIAQEPPETVEKYQRLASNAADSLIRSDPAACGSFLAGLPEAVRTGAIHSVHYYFLNEGFSPDKIAGTLNWITQLPDAGVRRVLAARICDTAGETPNIQQQLRQALSPFAK